MADDGTFGGIRAVLEARPQATVLLVSSDGDARTALRAIMAGATAYLLSAVSMELVVQVVRTINQGGLVLPRRIGWELAGQLIPKVIQRGTLAHVLSEREQRVLDPARGRLLQH